MTDFIRMVENADAKVQDLQREQESIEGAIAETLQSLRTLEQETAEEEKTAMALFAEVLRMHVGVRVSMHSNFLYWQYCSLLVHPVQLAMTHLTVCTESGARCSSTGACGREQDNKPRSAGSSDKAGSCQE